MDRWLVRLNEKLLFGFGLSLAMSTKESHVGRTVTEASVLVH